MDALFMDEQWMHTQAVPFDHTVHEYTLEEVTSRLAEHVGREVLRTQTYSWGTSSLQGKLFEKDGKYYLDNPHMTYGSMPSLTDSLVGRPMEFGQRGPLVLFTIIEVDRTDLYLAAKTEDEMRRTGKIN